MSVQAERWDLAQEYERAHWQALAESIAKNSQQRLTWYGWKAGELAKLIARVQRDPEKYRCNVLEVGSGPIGICTFWKATGRRVALDPLMDFYASHGELTELRDPAVEYLQGRGEELPAPDGQFDLVLTENAVDHGQDPPRILRELFRVTRPGGLLYFGLNIHGPVGLLVRQLMERFKIDQGHPHSYDLRRVEELIRAPGFQPLLSERERALEVWKRLAFSSSLKDKVKLLLGIPEYYYTALWEKPARP